MDDGTARRSLYAIVIAFGVVLIGAGCSKEEIVHQFTIGNKEDRSVDCPSGSEIEKKAVPFVACYRGESDLFLSTEDVPDVWPEQLREQINTGWFIDEWCRETDEAGAVKYALALRKTQGLSKDELTTAVASVQKTGLTRGGSTLDSESVISEWSLIKLAYVSSERNRANEIPLLLSEPIAVKNEGMPVDSISFARDLTGSATAPRQVVAEIHGGDASAWFMATFRYDSNMKALTVDGYCRTYFDSEDGSFSPEDVQMKCESSRVTK